MLGERTGGVGAQAGDRPLPAPLRGLPLLGSAPALASDLLGFLRKVDRERGPMASFRVGPRRWVLASHAEAIEEVLVARAGDFDKPDALYGHGRMIFGNALTGLKGAAWKRRRGIVAPAFHRQPLDAPGIAAAAGEWAAGASGRGMLQLDDELMGLMTHVACMPILGDDAEAAARDLAGPARAALRSMGTRAQLGVPLPDWLPFGPVRTMRRAVRAMDETIDRVVATRADRPADAAPDLLDALAALHDEHGASLLTHADVRAEVAVMAAVGGHQLALALAWALQLLDAHPDAERELHAELAGVLDARPPALDDLDALPLTAGTIDETLRLYPPFHLIGREALRDTTVDGWRIPAGTTVVLSPWVTQRLPAHFEAPDDFRPQRWTPQLRRALPRGAYLPWGGGGRLCVAQAAARKQLVLVLATIASHHRVRFDPRHPVVPKTTTSLEMRGGARARVEARA